MEHSVLRLLTPLEDENIKKKTELETSNLKSYQSLQIVGDGVKKPKFGVNKKQLNKQREGLKPSPHKLQTYTVVKVPKRWQFFLKGP